jgi:hypothetical protein
MDTPSDGGPAAAAGAPPTPIGAAGASAQDDANSDDCDGEGGGDGEGVDGEGGGEAEAVDGQESGDDGSPRAADQQLGKARAAPIANLSSRVRRMVPCGSCYQCTHSDMYVACARREDARYECYPVLIPLTHLGPRQREQQSPRPSEPQGQQQPPISDALLAQITAHFGSSPDELIEGAAAIHIPGKIPLSLVPSLLPSTVIRGIVHRVEGAPSADAGAGAGASAGGGRRGDVTVVVHFDHGAVVQMDERTFLRYTREPLSELKYRSPVVRQLSFQEPGEHEDPAGGSLRVLKELLRRGERYHRLEVRQTNKMKGRVQGLALALRARARV